jgi:hypothetical protein
MKTNASAIAALANDACGVAVIVDQVALSRPASSVLTCSRAHVPLTYPWTCIHQGLTCTSVSRNIISNHSNDVRCRKTIERNRHTIYRAPAEVSLAQA